MGNTIAAVFLIQKVALVSVRKGKNKGKQIRFD